MKYLEKLMGICEIFSLSSIVFSVLLLLMSFFLDLNFVMSLLISFEAGVMFGISVLVYIYLRINDRGSSQIEKAFVELDKISSNASQSSSQPQQSLWNKISSQRVNIIDKRSKGKRPVEIIGEKGEVF